MNDQLQQGRIMETHLECALQSAENSETEFHIRQALQMLVILRS